MSEDRDRDRQSEMERLEKGWRPDGGATGGYQPETNELGNPPKGGGGGKEPEKDEKD